MIQGLGAVPLPGSDVNAENANWSSPHPLHWRESFVRLTRGTGADGRLQAEDYRSLELNDRFYSQCCCSYREFSKFNKQKSHNV